MFQWGVIGVVCVCQDDVLPCVMGKQGRTACQASQIVPDVMRQTLLQQSAQRMSSFPTTEVNFCTCSTQAEGCLEIVASCWLADLFCL